MRGVNKVTLVGNLGNAPELKYTQDGTAIAKFSIATTDKWKDKNGEAQERTEWHHIEVWGRLAEICGEYLKKGSPVYLEGSIRYSKTTGQDGVERYWTAVRASEIRFLGTSGERTGGERTERPAATRQPASRPASNSLPDDDFTDDDIPF